MNDFISVLPQDFLSRLQKIIPENKISQVIKSFEENKISSFRANTLKISADSLEEKLKKINIQAERVSWYKDAFILKNTPQRQLMETSFYKEGYLYIQSLSSMIPPLILNPKPDEKILDLTAAPGSKTTQIAAMMENTGEIIANDKSHVRNYRLKANIALQGVKNAKVTQVPGQIIWKKIPEFFDKVLVDAPCSMEGRFFTGELKTYKDWSLKKIKFLQEQQKYLLRSAISSAKVGGIIVYSTCTLSPEENEGVLDWILKKEGDSIIIEDIYLPDLQIEKGLLVWNNKQYNTNVNKSARILPSPSMEAFFVAKIKKIKSNINKINS